ncbi:MAG: hypothetical protein ABSF63_15615 [Candidatus Bathyarchaeia archaeon]|jgi:hypothetical protein
MTPPSRLSYTRPLHPNQDNAPKQGVLHSSFALQIRGYPRLAPPTREAAPLFNKQVGLGLGWMEGGPHPSQKVDHTLGKVTVEHYPALRRPP